MIKAGREEVQAMLEKMPNLGISVEVDPNAALLAMINRSAGVLAWLELKVQMLDEAGLLTSNERGDTTPSIWIKLHGEERDRLAKFCKMALDAGVAERQVRIAEAQGQLIARLLKGVLADLNLTPDQQALSQEVVRRWLTEEMPALEGTVVDQ